MILLIVNNTYKKGSYGRMFQVDSNSILLASEFEQSAI